MLLIRPFSPIVPDAVYDEPSAATLTRLPTSTIASARRKGALRYSRQGNRILIRGAWLLAWLEQDANSRMEVAAAHA